MNINKSFLEAMAAKPSSYPEPNLPEIAFAGRSNVGKSSLLNMLVGRNNLARVSANPGKTQTINFYCCNDKFRIVDLPGYGYAKLSKSQREAFGPMIEAYLTKRESLLKVVQLIDSRHPPTDLDITMYEFLKYYDLAGVIVLTKCDKLSGNQLSQSIRCIKNSIADEEDIIIKTSAAKRSGQAELLEYIDTLVETFNSERRIP